MPIRAVTAPTAPGTPGTLTVRVEVQALIRPPTGVEVAPLVSEN